MAKQINKNKHRNARIAAMKAKGMSDKAISEQSDINISRSQVTRTVQREDVKDLIETIQLKYMNHIHTISDRFIDLCHSDTEAIALKAIDSYHKSIGITPSHAQSIFIESLYQTNAIVSLQPQVIEVLRQVQCESIEDGEVIE